MSDLAAAKAEIAIPMLKRPGFVIGALAVIALGLCIFFMTYEARGSWEFILNFRGRKLLALIFVGYAVAVSTVAFQTVTHNRILTPGIMGFDAMFMFLQTVLVFVFGGFAVLTANTYLMFFVELAVMGGFAIIVYGTLFVGAQRSLHLVMLVGIVLGILFRSLTDLMKRLIDPNEFSTLADLFYASFNAVQADLLGIAALIMIMCSVIGMSRFAIWDVVALGHDTATNLGVNYRRETLVILGLVTVFMSVATALVGPVTFFGLLVANLAYLITPSHKHKHIMPVAALLAIICLIGGQMVLERVFDFNSSISIIIEFLGGITFIILLLKGSAR